MAATTSTDVVAAPRELNSSSKFVCKPSTEGAESPSLGRSSRWAISVGAAAVGIVLVVADMHAFGDRVGSSNIAELILLSLAILLLRHTAPLPSAKQGGRKMRRKGPEGCAKNSVAGAAATSTARKNLVVSKHNQQINLAVQNGDLEVAEQLFLELERSDDQPDVVSYNLVLRACANRRDPWAAEKWLKRMEAARLQPSLCSYNTVLDACAKAGKPAACERWLNQMNDRGITANAISYATAIYAHARQGDVASAAALLRKMSSAGLQPDAVSYNALIHACSVKGSAHDAEQWLQEMHSQGLEGTVSSYTAVIDACAKSGDVERAEAWFSRMLEKGVEPNVVTFSSMIDACAKVGNLTRAEHWHDRMLERGVAPNAHTYSAIVHACAKRGGPSGAVAAEQWLDRSERNGVANDVVVYSSVIDACSKAGDAERGMEVFRRMTEKGLKPNIVAYAALARPYAYRGDWIKVESIAQAMAADGVKINDYFVCAQLLAYGAARPRQSQRAEACFRSALESGVAANDPVVGALSRAVGRLRCVALMNELCGGREVPSPSGRKSKDVVGAIQAPGARASGPTRHIGARSRAGGQ